MEVSQAGRVEAGAAPAEPGCTLEAVHEVRCLWDLDTNIEKGVGYVCVKVASAHLHHGERNGAHEERRHSRPSGENDCVIWGTAARP